jgi:hypothetical protein
MKARIAPTVLILLASTALVCAQEKIRRATRDLCAKPAPAEATPAPAPPAPKTAASTDSPEQIAAAFFALLAKSRVDEAYTNLTRGSKIAEHADEMRALKDKTSKAITMFGTIDGFDLVETKSVGTHLMRRTYLSLGKDFPLRWRFYFYRSDDRWRLVDLRVDDRLTGIFEETVEEQAETSGAGSTSGGTSFDQNSR